MEAGVARREKYKFQKVETKTERRAEVGEKQKEKTGFDTVELICKSQTPSHAHRHTVSWNMPELTLWGQMGGGELKDFSGVGLRFYKKNTLWGPCSQRQGIHRQILGDSIFSLFRGPFH